MKTVVVDANILFSALIKKSKTRELLLQKNDVFFVTPYYVLLETKKHFSLLVKKSGLSEEAIISLLKILFSQIRIIPREKLIPYSQEAKDIVRELDYYDSHYFAAALATKGIIWSNDKLLKNQEKIIVMNTKEFISQENLQ